MQWQFTGKNLEISDELKTYVQRKMDKLTRHLPNILQGEVEISRERTRAPEQRYVVQITLNHSGTILRGEQRAVNLYAVIDSVIDVMERQIERYKGKLMEKTRGIPPSKTEPAVVPTAPAELPEKVVKVKRFAVKPMPLEEAAEQMELLGHDFFVFYSATNNAFAVVYRRRDAGYGLLLPEVA